MKALNFAMLILMLSSTVALAGETVELETGYGTAVGFGADKKVALKNARIACGEGQMEQHRASRGDNMSEDTLAAIIDACVNLN